MLTEIYYASNVFSQVFIQSGSLFVSGNDGSVAQATEIPNFPVSGYTHLAIRFLSPQDSISIFLNGDSLTSRAMDNPSSGSNPIIYIGADNAGSSNYDGAIDEFRIWSTLRSPFNIAKYAYASIDNTNSSNLQAYLKFDQDPGDSLANFYNNTDLIAHLRNVQHDGVNLGFTPSNALFFKEAFDVVELNVGNPTGTSGTLTVDGSAFFAGNDFIRLGNDGDTGFETSRLSNTPADSRFEKEWYFQVFDQNSDGGDITLTFNAITTDAKNQNYYLLYRSNDSIDYNVAYFEGYTTTGSSVTFSVPADSLHNGYYNFGIDADGKPGTALLFDGIDDFVSIPYDASLNPGSITIEFWAQSFHPKWNSTGTLIGRKSNITPSYRVSPVTGTDSIEFILKAGGSPVTLTFDGSTIPNYSSSAWHHYAVTYEGNGIDMYLDGSLVTSQPATGALAAFNADILLGTDHTGEFLEGRMDELRIWDIALDSTTIQNSLYQQLAGNESNLILYYRFEGSDYDSTKFLPDLSGNNQVATLNNFNYDFGSTSGFILDFFDPPMRASGDNTLGFDGFDDLVNIPADPSLEGMNVLTIEAWTNPGDPTAYNPYFNYDDEGVYGFESEDFGSGPELTFYLTTTNGTYPVTAAADELNNGWTHIAAVYDGSQINVYVNGNLKADTIASGTVSTSLGGGLTLGYSSGLTTNYFGQIDNIRIWTAAVEVDTLRAYAITDDVSTHPDIANLSAHYDFNQGDPGNDNSLEATLLDRSTNANDGTLVNFDLNFSSSNWLSSDAFDAAVGNTQLIYEGQLIEDNAVITGSNNPLAVLVGDTTVLEAKLVNSGFKDVFILEIDNASNADIRVLTDSAFTLPPYDTVDIKIRYTPTISGLLNVDNDITIRNNGLSPQYKVLVEGYGYPDDIAPGNAWSTSTLYYLEVDSSVIITGSTERTIEAWIKTSSPEFPIFSMGEESDIAGTSFEIYLSAGVLEFSDGLSSGASGLQLNDNRWHHIAVVYDGVNDVYGYVDGTDSVFFGNLSLNTSGQLATIGRMLDSVAGSPGLVDELRLWEVSRTREEIESDMHVVLDPFESNLKAYYRMDQDPSEDSVYDLSNSHHAFIKVVATPPTKFFEPSQAVLLDDFDDFTNIQDLSTAWNFDDTVDVSSANLHIADLDFLKAHPGNNIIFGHDAAVNPKDLSALTIVTQAADTSWFLSVTDSLAASNGHLWMYWTGQSLDTTKTYYLLYKYKAGDPYTIAPYLGLDMSSDTLSFFVSADSLETGFYTWGSTVTDVAPANAIAFDDACGGCSFIAIRDTSAFTFSDGSNDLPFTLEFWMYLKQNSDVPFIEKEGGTGDLEYYLGTDFSGNLLFQTNDANFLDGFSVSSTSALPVNEWMHIAVVSTGGVSYENGISFYLNGQPISVNRIAAGNYIAMQNGTGDVTLAYSNINGTYLSGSMDELRIWNYARTQTEIQQHQYDVVDPSNQNLLAYYRFDQEPGSTMVPDLSGGYAAGELVDFFTINDSIGWVASTALQIPQTLNLILMDSLIGEEVVFMGATLEGNTSDTIKFKITNAGDVDLNLNSVTFAFGDMSEFQLFPPTTPSTVANGDTVEFSVVHNPSSSGIMHSVGVSVQTDDPSDTDLQFQLQSYAYPSMNGPGLAILFDGSSTTVASSDSVAFEKLAGEPYAVEFWINPDSLGSSGTYGILSLGDNSNGYFYVNYDTATERVFFGNNATSASIDIPAPFGQWTHVAISHDGVKTSAYRNGEFVDSTSNLSASSIDEGVLWIGEDLFSNIRPYKGQMDEIKIWDMALTAAEVEEGLNRRNIPSDSGLFAYYRFDENLTGQLYDISGTTQMNLASGTYVNSKAPILDELSEVANFSDVTFLWYGDTTGSSDNLTIIGNGFFSESGDQIAIGHDNAVENLLNENEGLTSTVVATTRIQRQWYLDFSDSIGTQGGNIWISFSGITDLDSLYTYYLLFRDTTTSDFEVVDYFGYTYGNTGDSITFEVNVDSLSGDGYYTLGRNDGKPGNALNFDGSDDAVTIHDPAYMSQMTTEFTIEMWMRLEAAPTTGQMLLSQIGSNNATSSFIVAMNTAAVPRLGVYNGSSFDGLAINPVDEISQNKWHHLAFTFKNGTINTYVDGKLSSSNTIAITSINDVATDLVIGNRQNRTGGFPGSIDELRIWNYERSVNQIQDHLYQPISNSDTGLVAYYRFDQDSTGFLPDLSKNNNFGSLSGFNLGNRSSSDWIASGAMTITDPVAFHATSVTDSSFIANWDRIGNADSIFVDLLDETKSLITTYKALSVSDSSLEVKSVLSMGDEFNYTISYFINGVQSNRSDTIPFYVTPGYALDFDGIDDSVSLTNTVFTDFTIQFWLKAESTNTGGQAIYSSVGNNDTVQVLIDPSGAIRFYLNHSLSPLSGQALGSRSVLDDKWHHIAVAVGYGGSLAMDIFIDGELDISAGGAGSIGSTSFASTVLGFNHENGAYFNGRIDELRFYQRTLNQTDIQENLYNTLPVYDSDLVGYYRFDHQTGIDLVDLSFTKSNGALHNFNFGTDTSNWVLSEALTEPLPAPTNLMALPNDGFVDLLWDSVAEATDYSIFYGTDTTSLSEVSFISDTLHSINSLDNDSLYYFAVSATDGYRSGFVVSVPVLESGRALSLNGTDQYVSIPNDPVTDRGGGDLTVSVWVYFDSIPALRTSIFDKRNGSGAGYELFYDAPTDVFHFTLRQSSFSREFVNNAFSSGIIDTLEWVNIVCTYKASTGETEVYFNGVNVGTNSSTAANLSYSSSIPLLIGNDESNTSSFPGDIDEFAIWDRVLGQVEIVERLNGPINALEEGLQLLYHFDEPTGEAVVYESTLNGIHGARINTPVSEPSSAMAPIHNTFVADTSADSVIISWNFLSTDVDRVVLFKSQNRVIDTTISSGDILDTVGFAGDTFYVDYNPIPNTLVYYQIVGIDSAGLVGGLSNLDSVEYFIDPFVVTDTTDFDSVGSIRYAINYANSSPGRDTITFDIQGIAAPWVIKLDSGLYIEDPVLIDATTQPGWAFSDNQMIEIDANGHTIFDISAPTTSIYGFEMFNYNEQAIFIGVGADSSVIGIADKGNVFYMTSNDTASGAIIASGVKYASIQGNLIGVDLNGNAQSGSAKVGMAILGSHVTIGGDGKQGNTVFNTWDQHSDVNGSIVVQGDSNVIVGNFVGVDSLGNLESQHGVYGINVMSGVGNQVGSFNSDPNFIQGTDTAIVIGTVTTADKNRIVNNEICSALPILLSNADANDSIQAPIILELEPDTLFGTVGANDGSIIHLYEVDTCSGRGNAGQLFVDSTTVTSGNWGFGPGIDVSKGYVVTVTDTASGTSPFSSSIGPNQLYVTDTTDSGIGSLREAIAFANLNPGPDTILFQLPYTPGNWKIGVDTRLPLITDTVVIDGSSQPGYDFDNGDMVEIVPAAGKNTVTEGLYFGTGLSAGNKVHGSVVKGLAIKQFNDGITIYEADDVQVGDSSARMLVVDNADAGILIQNSVRTRVQNTYIGVNHTGLDTTASGNNNHGIYVLSSDSLLIGGDASLNLGNVIGGNPNAILFIGSSNSEIYGNFIGIGPDLSTPVPNTTGILFNGNSHNNIVGAIGDSLNFIGFNTGAPISLGAAAADSNFFANNIIFCNGVPINLDGGSNSGIQPPVIEWATENQMQGYVTADYGNVATVYVYAVDTCVGDQGMQLIGETTLVDTTWVLFDSFSDTTDYIAVVSVDSMGTSAYSNLVTAVDPLVVTSVSDNNEGVGGIPGELRYAIANASSGDTISFDIMDPAPWIIDLASPLPDILVPLSINALTQPGANFVDDGLIKLNGGDSITQALGIDSDSVRISGLDISSFTSVAIASFGHSHILIDSVVANGFGVIGLNISGGQKNKISNCRIGTNVNGDVSIPSNGTGVFMDELTDSEISKNLISGNNLGGIQVSGSNKVRILENIIGLNASGTDTIPNGSFGILLTTDSVIVENNYISGNKGEAIQIIGSYDTIAGNVIGLLVDTLTARPNLQTEQIEVQGTNNFIGGFGSDEANIISGGDQPGYRGVRVQDDSSYNAIYANEFRDFADDAISLGAGANGGIGVPIITSAEDGNINGTSVPNALIQIYEHDTSSALPTGKKLIDTTYSDGLGDWSKTISVAQGTILTALADTLGNTSQFASTDTMVVIDPLIVTNLDDSGLGSLRGAIEHANSNSGKDTIRFAIPGAGPWLVNLTAKLPIISDEVIIDGTTQPSWNFATGDMVIIDVNGITLGSFDFGLQVSSQNVEIYGLKLSGWVAGVWADNSNSDSLVIGKSGAGNVIVDNDVYGIHISNADSAVIQGNYIGLDFDGITAKGNHAEGIRLSNSRGTLIGGDSTAGEGNIIAGNGDNPSDSDSDLNIQGVSSLTRVYGNVFGTSPLIDSAYSFSKGVSVSSDSILIGDSIVGYGNTFAPTNIGFTSFSISNSTGSKIVGNNIGLQVGANDTVYNRAANIDGLRISSCDDIEVVKNVIAGFTRHGLRFSGTSDVIVNGNEIGTNISGSPNVGNGLNGIQVESLSAGIKIFENIIAANGQNGIQIFQSDSINIYGNIIGRALDGVTSLSNGDNGVYVTNNSSFIVLGGDSTHLENIIADNGNYGLVVDGNVDSIFIKSNEFSCNTSGGIDMNASANFSILAPTIDLVTTTTTSGSTSGYPDGSKIHLYEVDVCNGNQGAILIDTTSVFGDSWTITSSFDLAKSYISTVTVDTMGTSTYSNVLQTNNPPSTNSDIDTLFENDTAYVLVLANDTDNQTLFVDSVITFGDSLVNYDIVNDSIKIIPIAQLDSLKDGEFLLDTLLYLVSDGLLNAVDTIYLRIEGVNDAPVAATDNTSTDEETLVYVDVQDNDSDVDGDALTTSILSGPSNGSASVENSDSISYTPGTNFTGADTIIYQISDGSLTDSDTVFITVNNVNDAPVASTDNTSTDEETLVYVDVQDNDSDIDGDALTTSILSGPSNGSASVENSDSISYTPGTNFTGADTIIYQISDGSLTDSDTVFITVNNVNDAPVASTDNTSTDEETLVYVDVQDNDSDIDGDALTTSILSGPSNGSASVENSDSISYTPGTNFTGADTIIYQISDGSLTDSDTVFITVNNVNDAPVAATDNTITDEETLVYVDVQDNDSDVDGDALTTSILSGPSNGSASVENSDSISYTPGTNFTGADTIIYQISDGSLTDSDTVFITVNNVNDAPVASTDNTITDEETLVYVDVQDNDSDIDGDALTTSILSGPSNGSASVENSDSISYTPGTNFTGADTIIYQISDGSLTDSDTVFITVNNVNDAPVASTDNTSTDEETLVYVDVQDNDSDIDGDALTTSILSGPSNGSASVENSDSISYTPGTNFTGADTIIYQISDGSLTDSDTVFITVTNVNDAPVASTDNTSTDEETLVYVDVQDNDSDVDGDALTTSILSGPSNGSASVENSDSISYTPGTNFTGADTIIYQISDGSLTDSDTVFITVNNVNDAPVASTDNTSTDEETLVYVDVQDNDSDIDGDALTTSILSGPSNGSASVENSDSISYTPGTNFTGADTIIYQISDGSLTDSDTVFITVNNVNDAPVASTDNTITDEETLVYVDVQDNDSDVDGDALTTSILSGPSNGSASVENSDSISYTPGTNFTGADTIIYQISDGSLTDSDTVFITVNNVNDAPVAATDNTSTDEETLVYVDVQNNDSDIDGDVLTTSILSGPSNGSASVENSDSISYTPGTNFTGADTIIYQISDGSLTDSDTVFITVNNVNDAPVASTDNTITDEETLVYVDVQDNDSDVDGDVLTTSILSGPSNGSASVENSDSISYTPGTNFTGADTIIYQISDGSLTDSDTVFITVNNVNDAPVAATDNTSTDEETLVYVDVQDNDSDVDGDALTTSILSGPSNGSASVENSDSISYTPGTNFTGADTIIYQISDGSLTDSDTVFITVNNVNDAPVASTDNTITDEETLVYVDVQDNDSDVDGDVLTTSILSGPSNGSASVENSDSISYTPGTNFAGSDTIIYQISDGSLTDSDTVFITVNNVNDAPVASTDNTSTDEETLVYVDVQANDSDIDGDALTTSILSGPSNGSASVENSDSISYTPGTNFTGTDTIIYQISDGSLTDSDTVFITVNNVNDAPVASTDNTSTDEETLVYVDVQDNDSDVDGDVLTTSILSGPSNGSASVENSDSISYTPDTNFTGSDTIIYQISDGSLTDSDTVFITVNNVNDAPVAVTDNTITDEETLVYVDVQDNDSDIDGDALTTSILSGPSNGSASVENSDSISYTPGTNFTGADTIIYQISDGSLTDSDTVFITVNNVNDAPVASTDNTITDEETLVYVDVQDNDSDIDGDALTTSILSGPSNGSASVENSDSISYTPGTNFTGADTIIYQISDGSLTDSDTVFITVTNVNDAPVASTDNTSTDEETLVYVDVQDNDSDIDGDALTTSILSGPSNGSASVENSDSISYTPGTNFTGADTIIYQISDGSLTDSDTVFITVNNVNDAPVAVTDNTITDEETLVYVDVQDNDSDVDGDALTTSILSGPSNGSASVENSDSISYTPGTNFTGADTIIYQISDGSLTDSDTVFITVNNVNDAPVAINDSVTVDQGILLNISVVGNDMDVDGDVLIVSILNQPSDGTATLNGNSIDYQSNDSFDGEDIFEYFINDGNGGLDTAKVVVTVNSVNDNRPVVTANQEFKIDENATIGTSLGVLLASDLDGDPLSNWQIISGSGLGVISIDASTGELTTNVSLDFETSQSYTLGVTVFDGINVSDTAVVQIKVQDIDDTAPAGFSFSFDQNVINSLNEAVISFNLINGEDNAVLDYVITDFTDSIRGSVVTTSASAQVTGLNLSSLSDGIIGLYVQLTDSAGNVSDFENVVISKDALLPVVTIDSISSNQQSPEFTGTVDDESAALTLIVDSREYVVTSDLTGVWNLPAGQVSDLGDGLHIAKIRAIDSAGNVSFDSVGILIDITLPVITINSITTDLPSPEITGTINDVSADILITINSLQYVANNNGEGTWTLPAGTITELPAVAIYEVIARATDALGNVATDNTIEELNFFQLPNLGEPQSVGSFGFTINWDAVQGAENYTFELSEVNNIADNIKLSLDQQATSLTVTDLYPGLQYFFRVKVAGTENYTEVASVQLTRSSDLDEDSLYLVQLYAQNGGEDWVGSKKTGWLSNLLRSWKGVTLTNFRVGAVDLSEAGLTGRMPTLTGNQLSNCTSFDVSGNRLIDVTGVDGMSDLTSIKVEDNSLDFADFESFTRASRYTLAPQKNLLGSIRLVQEEGQSVTMTRTVPGTDNTYQWFNGDEEVIGQTSDQYALSNVLFEDEGSYFVEVRNSKFADVVLRTEPYVIKVSSLERDRIVLQEIYDMTNGDSWTNNSNWNSSSPLNTWFGVLLNQNNSRVIGIDLTDNNLVGEMPVDLNTMTGLTSVSLSTNEIQSMPDMSEISGLTTLNVSNNKLDFDDLEPNVSIANFSFENQGKIGIATFDTIKVGETFTFRVDAGGENNEYQWQFNGEDIVGANLDSLQVTDMEFSKIGNYLVNIKNNVGR